MTREKTKRSDCFDFGLIKKKKMRRVAFFISGGRIFESLKFGGGGFKPLRQSQAKG